MAAAQPGPPRGLALPPWSRRGGRAAACPRPRCSRRAAEPPAAIGPAVLPHDLADLAAAAAGHRRDDSSRAVAASRRPLTRNRTLATWHLVSKTPEVGTRQRSRCGSPGGGSRPGSAGRRPLAPHALPGSEGSRAQGGVRPDPDPHGGHQPARGSHHGPTGLLQVVFDVPHGAASSLPSVSHLAPFGSSPLNPLTCRILVRVTVVRLPESPAPSAPSAF